MSKTLKSLLKDLASTIAPMLVIVVLVHFGTNVSAGDAVGHYADDPKDLPTQKSEEDEHYADDVSDLPVYDGMVLKDDMNTVFDSPDGRIVDVVMEGSKSKEKAALSFYEKTLPQLGWVQQRVQKFDGKEAEVMLFERGEEQLAVNVDDEKNKFLLKFSIRPKED